MSSREKRRVFASAIGVLVLATVAWLALRPRDPEPVYQGRKLSEWLVALDPTNNNHSIQHMQEMREAVGAIRQMGTNCLPTLLRMLEKTDSPLKLRLVALAQKQPFFKVSHVPDASRYARAAEALVYLSPKLEGAGPELIRIYDQTPSPTAKANIAWVLAAIGPPPDSAVPALLRGATNTDDAVRGYTLEALGRIHSQPEVVVPVLINALNDSYPGSRFSAAQGLGNYGREATSALPALIKFIEARPPPTADNPPQGMTERDTAVEALWKIDPQTAAKVLSNRTSMAK